MENFFVRYKNPLVLMAVLFVQVVALATQVRRPDNARTASSGGTRLIRVWTVTAFTPVEKMFVSTGRFFRNGWHNYVDLRDARKRSQDLQDEVTRLQMERAQLKQDADQARRLQVLLDFKEKYVGKTVAAQVIATSGTEQSRVITIDKGRRDGLKTDMAVITPDGIVGKIKEVLPLSSQVLVINDHDSGAGVILESTRLQGIVKGTSLGELQINDVMSDEKVEAGERVITSGGDRIFPKGLPVGTVISSIPDRDNDPFLNIKIKPAANLNRLEEVLVVTEMAERAPAAVAGNAPMRAADILSQRLPSIPKQDPNAPKTPGAATNTTTGPAAASPAAVASPANSNKNTKPADSVPEQKKGVAGANTALKTPTPSGQNAPAKSPAVALSPAASTTGAVQTARPAAGTIPGSLPANNGQPVRTTQPVGANPISPARPVPQTQNAVANPAGTGANTRPAGGTISTGVPATSGPPGAVTPTGTNSVAPAKPVPQTRNAAASPAGPTSNGNPAVKTAPAGANSGVVARPAASAAGTNGVPLSTTGNTTTPASKPVTNTNRPAATGQASTVPSTVGTTTPTPTPKPRVVQPAKPKPPAAAPASSPGASGENNSQPQQTVPAPPAPAPTPTPERPQQ